MAQGTIKKIPSYEFVSFSGTTNNNGNFQLSGFTPSDGVVVCVSYAVINGTIVYPTVAINGSYDIAPTAYFFHYNGINNTEVSGKYLRIKF